MEKRPVRHEAPYNENAIERITEYRAMIHEIFRKKRYDVEIDQMLAEADKWFEDNILNGGFSDEEVIYAIQATRDRYDWSE